MKKVNLDIVEALQALKDGEIVCGIDDDGGDFCIKANKRGYLEIHYVDDVEDVECYEEAVADFKTAEYADYLNDIIPPEIYSLRKKILWKYVDVE